MKLCEILTEREMIGKIPVVRSQKRAYTSAQHKDVIGTGYQAKVYQPKASKKSNSVVKVANVVDVHSDAYVKFINIVLDHQDNPFFPRIHNAKIVQIEDPSAEFPYQMIVQMEKLIEVKNSKIIDTARHLFDQIGITDEVYREVFMRTSAKTLGDKDQLFDSVLSLKVILNNKQFRAELVSESKSPKFVEAMKLLEPLLRSHRRHGDMHLDNWMIRLTGTGPQLVIVDPVMT